MRHTLRSLLFALLSVVLLNACGDEPVGSGVFIGTLRGGEVFAASIWQSDRVLVYTCGRDTSLADSTAWLVGPVNDGTVEVDEPPFSVVATRDGASVMGSFSNGAVEETLALDQVEDVESAGFFARVVGPCRSAAVVFKNDAGELAFQGAHFCDDGRFFQITPVRPPEILGDVIQVRFDDGDGAQDVELARLEGI